MLDVLTQRSPTADAFRDTSKAIVNFVTGQFARYCIPTCTIDSQAIESSLVNSYGMLRGFTEPSTFKVVASFTSFFVAAAPIKTRLPQHFLGKLANKQNAVLAFHISVDALHGAELHTKNGIKILSNRIQVSEHYYEDFIEHLSSDRKESDIPLISLIYESLAYQMNPKASYLEDERSRRIAYTPLY